MDNEPTQTANAIQEFLKQRKGYFSKAKLVTCPPPNRPCRKLKAQRPTNKQKLKVAAIKTYKSSTEKDTQHFVMSMG